MIELGALYRIQEIELEILTARSRLRDIQAALGENEALVSAQAAFDTAQGQLAPLRARSRHFELEIQSNVDKTRSAEDRLYSGSVKNPKELQDIQHEIASLKKWHSELEDQMLEAMLAVEEAEEAMRLAQAHLDAVSASFSTEHGQLIAERDQLKARDTVLRQDREKRLAAVEPDLLKLYNSLRPRKNNQPIALMEGDSCSVCGVEQTRMIADAARRRQEIVYCTSCERILYAH
jgi:predicted  nucleic acid-binding Zn-ribbon protein